ncbi:MAG: chain-length determining protein [Prevotella sp.]|jgi:uncharacterized protein involved in exopolysaccharide biosynthesis
MSDTSEHKDRVMQIDIVGILKAMGTCKKVYLIVLPITFILSCLLILCVPRYYTSTVKLAPELSSYSSNSLTDIASSFGFDMGINSGNGDAIFPELYPDLMASSDFLISLFDVRVKSKDNVIDETYYSYLATKQKLPFWSHFINWLKSLIPSKDIADIEKKKGEVNPFMLTKKQNSIANKISKNITCNVDKKNYVISITVKDQDALICATMADTVKVHLQQFITKYRTNKARKDYEFYKDLCAEAKQKYEKARRTYGSYADANQDVLLESFKSKQADLENEMQLLYNNYSALRVQMQQAQAKVQEQTPAFTTLQNASVPIKPSGPKRMLFVLGMTFLAFIIVSLYSLRDLIFKQ